MPKKRVKKSLSIPKLVLPALKPRAKEQKDVKGGSLYRSQTYYG